MLFEIHWVFSIGSGHRLSGEVSARAELGTALGQFAEDIKIEVSD